MLLLKDKVLKVVFTYKIYFFSAFAHSVEYIEIVTEMQNNNTENRTRKYNNKAGDRFPQLHVTSLANRQSRQTAQEYTPHYGQSRRKEKFYT
jgi:hypothetical protein